MYAQHPLPSNAGVKALLILAVCWPLTAIDATAKASFEFDVLVYNTHGLPSIIAGDRPSERFPRIAELTKGYELALLQEDFAHHELLLGSLPKSHSASRGDLGRSWLAGGAPSGPVVARRSAGAPKALHTIRIGMFCS